jgi:hypothetical protein
MKNKMKHSFLQAWGPFIAAPFVLAGIAFGLWLAVSAAFENIRLVRATDQILGVVATARDVAQDPRQTDALATMALFDRLGVPRNQQGSSTAMENPWELPLAVKVFTSDGLVRIENQLSSSSCRHLILLFAKDAVSLGLQGVDVLPSEGGRGRQLYDASPTHRTGQLDQASITAGCGDAERVVLALSFALR